MGDWNNADLWGNAAPWGAHASAAIYGLSQAAGYIGKWIGAPATSTPPSAALKLPVSGLGPRNYGSVITSRVDDIGFVVAEVYWRDLQPVQDGPLILTQAAADAAGVGATFDSTGWGTVLKCKALTWSNSHPDVEKRGQPVPIRLRIQCGRYSPDWAKALGVGPISLVDAEKGQTQHRDASGNLVNDTVLVAGVNRPASRNTVTVPDYVDAGFRTSFVGMHNRVAAVVEPDSQIREVASHYATTLYAEPFQRGIPELYGYNPGDPNYGKTNAQMYYESHPTLLTGVTVGAGGAVTGPNPTDRAAVMWLFDRLPSGKTRWAATASEGGLGYETTRCFVAINPFQQYRIKTISPWSAPSANDPAGCTAGMISDIASQMGPRVILGNTSLRVPIQWAGSTIAYPTMYANIVAQTRVEHSFQTATVARITEAYQAKVPGATDAQALAATLDVGLGLIHDALSDGTPSNDTLNLVVDPADIIRCHAIELPPGWGPLLTSAQMQNYNLVAAGNPVGV